MKFIEKTRWGPVEVITTEDGGSETRVYPPEHPFSIVISAFDATPFVIEEYAMQEDLSWLVSTVISFDNLPPKDLLKRVILEIYHMAKDGEWHNECKDKTLRKKMLRFYKDCEKYELELDTETLLNSLNEEPVCD
jgi:hypothetical protein